MTTMAVALDRNLFLAYYSSTSDHKRQMVGRAASSSDILVLKMISVLVLIQFWVNNFYFSFSFSFEIILVSVTVSVLNNFSFYFSFEIILVFISIFVSVST